MVLLALAVAPPLRGQEREKVFGDAHFIAYEGPQPSWPTADHAQVIKDFAVPIYLGLPEKSYKVLGRIYDPRSSGFGIVLRAFAEGLFPEKDRQRDCANQAQYRGADAVVVTNDPKLVKAFDLDSSEIAKSAPLFNHKHKIVLAVKFK